MELSRDMLQTKSVFEQRIQEFEEIKLQIQNKGGSEIIKIQNEHRNELDRLNGLLTEKTKSYSIEKEELMSKHEAMVSPLTQY